MTAAAVVVLPPLDGQQAQAWDTLMAVAEDLGTGWTLGLGRSADGGEQRCTRAVPSIGSLTLAFRSKWSFISNGVSLRRRESLEKAGIDYVLVTPCQYDRDITP